MLKESILEESKIAKSKKTNLKEELAAGDWAIVVGGLATLLGISTAIVKNILTYMKDNNLKGVDGFKKAYDVVGKGVSGTMDKAKGIDEVNEAKKKPSAGLSKKKKSEIVKKAKKGEDIGKKGKGFEKIEKKAAKEYGSKEAGKKVAAAALWKNTKRK